jgi:hypothetical protein
MSSAAICSGVAGVPMPNRFGGLRRCSQTIVKSGHDDDSAAFMREPSAREADASIGAIVQPVTGLR